MPDQSAVPAFLTIGASLLSAPKRAAAALVIQRTRWKSDANKGIERARLAELFAAATSSAFRPKLLLSAGHCSSRGRSGSVSGPKCRSEAAVETGVESRPPLAYPLPDAAAWPAATRPCWSADADERNASQTADQRTTQRGPLPTKRVPAFLPSAR